LKLAQQRLTIDFSLAKSIHAGHFRDLNFIRRKLRIISFSTTVTLPKENYIVFPFVCKFHWVEYYCPRDSEGNWVMCYIGLTISCLNKVGTTFANMYFIIDQLYSLPAGMLSTTLLFKVCDGVWKAWFVLISLV